MPSDIQTFPNVSFFVTSLARKFAPLTAGASKPLIFLSAADDRVPRLTSKRRQRDNASAWLSGRQWDRKPDAA